ncbi:RNase H domain protein [Phlyctema vagabunda]|uniref:Ribonuclease H n=1 Tax=Phlyctema vagabunda TaxID=108571 RepID=A0ABR4PW27_9HELO
MPASSTKKRKHSETTMKYYAVRAGHKPGVYTSWDDCIEQITGFRGASHKSFPTRKEAELFAAGQPVPAASTPASQGGVGKFYGVAKGVQTGVYENWDEALAQITGVKNPKYKKFTTRAEAEEFVASGGNSKTGKPTPTRAPAAKPKPKREASVELEFQVEDDMSDSDLEDTSAEVETPPAKKAKVKEEVGKEAPLQDGKLVVYTDGSSLGNGKVGARAGVGVYFGSGDPRNVSEPLKGATQTNQRAELTAILRALQICPVDVDIRIITDSNYSINCCSVWYKSWKANGWKTSTGTDVLNKDLVSSIRALIDKRDKKRAVTEFEWIKGHSSDPGNTAADALAVNAARAVLR